MVRSKDREAPKYLPTQVMNATHLQKELASYLPYIIQSIVPFSNKVINRPRLYHST